VVTKRMMGVFDAGKTYHVLFLFTDGEATFQCSDTIADLFLARSAARVPGALIGFSKEISKLYKDDKVAFVEAVKLRKGEFSRKG
jgi:hypothetical protein